MKQNKAGNNMNEQIQFNSEGNEKADGQAKFGTDLNKANGSEWLATEIQTVPEKIKCTVFGTLLAFMKQQTS